MPEATRNARKEICWQKLKSLPWKVIIPNALTCLRPFLGLVIALLGFSLGEKALEIVFWLLIAGWTTDVLDGKYARALGKTPDWIGENDIFFDSLMLVGVLIYLGYTGYLPLWTLFALAPLLFAITTLPVVFPSLALKITFHEKLVVEAPIAVFTFPFIVYLLSDIAIIKIALIWASLSFVYDIDRAMALKNIWQEIFRQWLLKLRARPFPVYIPIILLTAAAALIFTLIFIIAKPQPPWSQAIVGIGIALFLVAVYMLLNQAGKQPPTSQL